MKKLILIVCTLFSVQALSAQKAELKYRLEPGREYTKTENSKIVIKQVIMGMTISMDMYADAEISYKVRSFTDGIFELEARYAHAGMEIQSAYINMKVDSRDDPSGNIMSQVFTAMIGKPFIVKMTPAGKIKDIEGLSEMLEEVAVEILNSEVERARVKEQLDSSYGKDAFIKSFEQMMAIYPDDAVANGDKWIREGAMNSNGLDLNVVTEYEFAGLQDGLWVIKGKSKMSTPKNAKMYSQGIEMDAAMEGFTELEIKVDPATGWVIASVQAGDIDGLVSAEEPMQGRMDIDMTMSLSSKGSGSKK